ncbi:hypothetical protein SeLEV6574_g03858 [Synchytrium endobioticum]|uniref:Uncharacterized protein n=1 Tax=Synchytrium endobioticum TaxID=286115 RepID=A0A507D213_9FUNG|nr:hypothetical protein SeLEV6574_g03858 [Synchytrium endobioticum]
MEKEKPWTLVTRKKTGQPKKQNGIDKFKAQIEKQDENERKRVLERMISGRNAKPGYRRLTFILVKGISRQSVNQVQKILVMMGLDIANFVTARFQNSDVCELVIYEDAEEEYKRVLGLASHTEVLTKQADIDANTRRTYLAKLITPAKFFNLNRAYLNSEIRKLATDKAKETDPAATRATTPKKATTSNE